MFKKYLTTALISFLIILLFSPSKAQNIAIGEWRTQLPYAQVIDVAVAGDVIFAATAYSMFTYNTGDSRIELIDRVKGLSDVGINKIDYNKSLGALLVVYSNGNMDIIRHDGSIINISDIKDKDILGNKAINNIMIKDDYAYLSCGFGIVVLDMAKEEIYDTYYIGSSGDAINVLDMTYNDTSFFAATESGIYYADINSDFLADFNQWHKDNQMIHPNLTYNSVESFAGNIYANYYNGGWDGDTMFVFNGQDWEYFEKQNNNRHHDFLVRDDKMYCVSRYSVEIYNTMGINETIIWQIAGEGFQPLAIDKGSSDILWIGDSNKGLIKNWNIYSGEFYKPNGPGTKNVFVLDAEGKNVWVAPGGRQSNWGKSYNTDGVFSYIDNTWNTISRINTPAMDTISDMVTVKVDPNNPSVAYVGSFDDGVLKFENNELKTIFSVNNSSLRPWVASTQQVNVSGLDYDSHHNLWIANSGAPDILSVMKNDGNWRSFNLGGSISGIDVDDLMVDNNNQIWIINRSDMKIFVFNYNNTIDNITDDKVKVINSSVGNGAIPGNKIYSMATDQDGEVWVGSDQGVCVFRSPSRIFESGVNFDAQQILVPRNDGSGLADILLETETVTSIAIDGANRKWIGTQRAGVFLLSADGLEQIYHFTSSNSPLLSNSVIGVTINSDGEVFIGTDNGIISFRGTATPEDPDSPVYAFPNPVREDYTGIIAIKGLVNGASVKITDSYGNLVYETISEGGQATWDGKNFSGRQSATGIYLVFMGTSDGNEKVVTKILVVR
jgi:streptogramin lyase